MNLKQLINQYVSFRRSLGDCFQTNERILKIFSRAMGYDVDIADINTKKVNAFLYGTGPTTNYWFKKHNALIGFYRYSIGRGHVDHSPLPVILPKKPPSFVPYIYTHEEIHRLLAACFTSNKSQWGRFNSYVLRGILLLLYASGLRISEALSLKMSDVDLSQSLIIIRETKFFKSRLVPIGPQLTQEMNNYIRWRKQMGYSQNKDSPFFIRSDGKPGKNKKVEEAFRLIRQKAGIKRTDGARYQPRLHDLRHSFAVHRLITWYQQGANVGDMLPLLSVYLGHAHLSATSVYLSMTPQLLQEAGMRFEKYAIGGKP